MSDNLNLRTRAAKLAALFYFACVSIFMSWSVLAHQQKAAITKIMFNPHTENIEIVHRFYIHDAEHAVKKIWGKSADILQSAKTQSLFNEYVASRFEILDSGGKALSLESIGYELEGQFFWVYQETAQPPTLKGLQVKHDALREIWSSQTNTVNIERLGQIKTLSFKDNVELLSVTFN